MNDSGARRNYLEVIKGTLAPTKELVTLAVSLVFISNVSLKGIRRACNVNNNGVVDN